MLIDLHTHSYPQSDDAFMAVDDLIDAAKSRGLDGICLTDHDRFWSQDQVGDLSDRHEFLVLAGSEVNTDTGHVLVFGLHEYVFGLHKPAFLHRRVKASGGVMIAAHPHRRRFLEDPGHLPEARAEMLDKASSDKFFLMCDAVEGLNGRATLVQNSFSQDLTQRMGAKMTAGSDAHRSEQVGTAATQFERNVTDLAGLITELKAGRFRAVDLTNGNHQVSANSKG
ncbi:MAG: hypothetical protein BZY88_14895 [SAR202 cluster bacterium Io17-Chloro-G9]|nr:MAG: hypothetical protein BZY88_14895 [SAR202 cluster bacterium Io17-Chloro-G9]